MGKQLRLILMVYIVNCEWTSVQLHSPNADQAVINEVNELFSESRENLPDLFGSLATNNLKKSETYQDVLKEEMARGRHTFDAMKEELWAARYKNVNKKRNLYKESNADKNIVAVKRETDEKKAPRRYDNAQTTSETIIKSTTTLSPEEMVKEFSKLTDSKKESALNELLGSCNDVLKRVHDHEHNKFFADCAANYTNKIQFLEQTYMTAEYIEAHEDIGMVRDILIEEKFRRVYLSPNSSYQNLWRKYNDMTDAEQQQQERTAFEEAMRPMYHESRQFMWELFVRWLLETSFWSQEPDTSTRLTELRDTLSQVVNDQVGFRSEDFVRHILVNWDDGLQDTKTWPNHEGKRAYNEFLLVRRIFETIMKLRIGRISEGDEAYGAVNEKEVNLATECADTLQHLLLAQAKIELDPVEGSLKSDDHETRYSVDAVPDIVRDWNDGKSKTKSKKIKGERRTK